MVDNFLNITFAGQTNPLYRRAPQNIALCMSIKIRHGNSYLKKTLCQAVFAAKKQKGSPLAERFYQIKSRRGPQKATVALAHQLLKIAYILLRENLTYQELIAQEKTTRDELVA